jgi:hypothetical protein
MAVSRKFANIKMGLGAAGAVGPQTFPLGTTWISAPVPARGARLVIFRLTSTDANVPASFGFNVSTSPNKASAFEQAGAGNNYNTRGVANIAMNGPGGWVVSINHPDGYIFHDFVVLSVTSNAGAAHLNVTVDSEVIYVGDALDAAQSLGQGALAPL